MPQVIFFAEILAQKKHRKIRFRTSKSKQQPDTVLQTTLRDSDKYKLYFFEKIPLNFGKQGLEYVRFNGASYCALEILQDVF